MSADQPADFLHKDEVQGKSRDFKSFQYLLKFSRPFAGLISSSLVLLVFSGLCGVTSARYLGRLVQDGLVAHNMKEAGRYSAIIIFLELVSVAASYYGRLSLSSAASRTILRIREKLFSQLGELPMTYFDRQPLGRTVTRLTYDVEGLEDFFSGTLARLLIAIISLVVVLSSMLIADFKLGAMLALTVSPAILVTWLLRSKVRHLNREFAQRNSAINARLSEYLAGIGVIRAFGAEEWSQTTFDSTVNSHLSAAIRLNVLNAWSRPVILLLCYFPLMTLLSVGGARVFAGTMSIGLFVTFIRFCERFSRPISALAQEIHTIQTAFTNAERITHFLTRPTEADALGPDGTRVAHPLKGEISFKNVVMSYDGSKTVLKNLNFNVEPASKIGFAGRTGSGKTTTLGLLARLYEFQEGEILVDGVSIREYSRSSLRSQIGYVSQDVVIFKGSVRENLAFGSAIQDSALVGACNRTGLTEILRTRGLTLDTLLLDQGANLSFGERQLLALTRVLVKNPSLLIMDEATANIDPGYEKLVSQAVESLMKGRTCFFIAHRLATLRDCDSILVFRDGQLVERGNHDKLLNEGGYYSELIRSGDFAATTAPQGLG